MQTVIELERKRKERKIERKKKGQIDLVIRRLELSQRETELLTSSSSAKAKRYTLRYGTQSLDSTSQSL